MARFMDKIKDFIAGPYDDEYEDEYEEYEEEPVEEYHPRAREKREVKERDNVDYVPAKTSSRRGQSQVVDFNGVSQTNSSTQQVVIIKPECYEDAQGICDQIKVKHPVVVNLEKVEFPVAQRIMDFLSGTCYALDGTIQRVSSNIFIIAPVNYDISNETREDAKFSKSSLPSWMSINK